MIFTDRRTCKDLFLYTCFTSFCHVDLDWTISQFANANVMANICGWMCIFLHTYTCKYIHKEIYILSWKQIRYLHEHPWGGSGNYQRCTWQSTCICPYIAASDSSFLYGSKVVSIRCILRHPCSPNMGIEVWDGNQETCSFAENSRTLVFLPHVVSVFQLQPCEKHITNWNHTLGWTKCAIKYMCKNQVDRPEKVKFNLLLYRHIYVQCIFIFISVN